MNKKIFFLIICIFILNSCQGVKDALEGKRRSKTGDEFLIEKKNPLSLPPNFGDLPKPNDKVKESEENLESSTEDLEELFNQTVEENNNNVNEGGSVENLILQEINRD